MSKVIDSLVQSSIDGKNYAGVVLCRLHFDTSDGPYRYNNTGQTVYWDEDGEGEEAYLGLGELASISVLPETGELGAATIQLTLSGVPAGITNEAFGDNYRNRPVYLWYGTLDKETYAIEGGRSGPVLVFAGLMDYCNVEFGKSSTITLNATSRLADWERPRGGRFNDGYQRRYVDATDDGFEYVLPLQTKEISWGGRTLLDGGFGAGGGGTNPSDPPIRPN